MIVTAWWSFRVGDTVNTPDGRCTVPFTGLSSRDWISAVLSTSAAWAAGLAQASAADTVSNTVSTRSSFKAVFLMTVVTYSHNPTVEYRPDRVRSPGQRSYPGC